MRDAGLVPALAIGLTHPYPQPPPYRGLYRSGRGYAAATGSPSGSKPFLIDASPAR